MSQLKEKLEKVGFTPMTLEKILNSQKLNKTKFNLFARHVKLLDSRVAYKYRRSIQKKASFMCLTECPEDPAALPNISHCLYLVDEVMYDSNHDLIGRIRPFNEKDERALALLNNPDFFELVKFKPVLKNVDKWTSISGLYLVPN